MLRRAGSTSRQWHSVNYLIDLPHSEHGTNDRVAVSNCARDLVRREYHEIDLLYGWTKHPIFKQHPLAMEIENAADATAWQEIINYQHVNKAFEAPVFKDITSCNPEIKDAVSIDRWLVSCTNDAWSEVSESEHGQLPTARMFLLLRILRIQLNQLRSQTPKLFLGGNIEEDWIKGAERSLNMAQGGSLPPPWGLCDLAAHIVSKRWEIEGYCVESLALHRIQHTFTDDSTESTAVRNWLLDRYEDQLYPIGRPMTKKEASVPSKGKSKKGSYKKACDRMMKNWPLITIIRKKSFKDVLQRLQKADMSWCGLHDPLDILDRLRPLFEKENSTMSNLDGEGWDAVGILEAGISIPAKPNCSIENLELSSSRMELALLSNKYTHWSEFDEPLLIPSYRFEMDIPDLTVESYKETFVDPRSAAPRSGGAFSFRGGFCISSSIYYYFYYPVDLLPGTDLDNQNSAWVSVSQRFAFNETDLAIRKLVMGQRHKGAQNL